MSDKKRLPKSDFGRAVGDVVTIYLDTLEIESLETMGLPIENECQLEGRLVGVDRPGLWIEPKVWFEESRQNKTQVRHIFLKWDNVIGLVRSLDCDLFEVQKEYRGLRPRQ